MNDSWTERLSEDLDGELAPEDRTLCEAHVATCVPCTSALEGLRDVVARARALPEIPPAEDLWPGIASRIAALAQEAGVGEGARPARPAAASRPARSISFSWPQLAAAGIALVALSAATSWYAAGRLGQGAVANAPSNETSSGGSSASNAAATADQERYDATVAQLQKELDQRRNELEPQTVSTIEANLKIIDLAAQQARQALDDDPSNPYLKEHLSKTMQRKVDLLREATVLASTH